MTELVVIGDSSKVIKNADSRPVTLYRAADGTGDSNLNELGSAYTVPAGKVLQITDIALFSGNAGSYIHCTLKDAANTHQYYVINKDQQMTVKCSDIFTAGTTPVFNGNNAGLTCLVRGVEYSV
tara:strand:+ start:836 stop:1207 length:372 start_codon:yes stop_codon:yes gene_type:complete